MVHPVRRALVVVVLACVSACSGDPAVPAAEPARPATLAPGDAIPAVAEPVLTLTPPGDAATPVALDVETVAAVGTSTVTLFEPWLERDVTFEGVWMSDLLAVAGAEGGTEVHLHAIDDYEVDFDAVDLAPGDAMLATHADGAPIDVADGGPLRLVFVRDDGPGANIDLWIWNVDAITVR